MAAARQRPARPRHRQSGKATPAPAPTPGGERRYWLFKSEPGSYGFDQFERDGRTFWSGVRNYQARNLLRDEIRVGDGVLFYHSNAEPTAVVGIARVVRAGYPDPTQFDANSPYHDPDSDPAAPRWFVVDIACVGRMPAPVARERLKQEPALAAMVVLQRGSRLSVQPVRQAEWRRVLELGGQEETW